MRTLVGGIGYHNLRDHSVGLAVAERLAARPWPLDVVVEDLSYNPIAVVQRLDDEGPGRRFARAVLVAGVSRPGRRAGAVTYYRWDGGLPGAEQVQRAVADAVTGVIALDNTLIVGGHFGAWPEEVLVVEVEPAVHEFGETLSPAVAAVVPEVCELVTRLATDPDAARALRPAPLGAGRPAGTPAP